MDLTTEQGRSSFETMVGRAPSPHEVALSALEQAERNVIDTESQIAAVRARMAVLSLQLDRNRTYVILRQQEADEAGLAELAAMAPRLTEVDRNLAIVKTGAM